MKKNIKNLICMVALSTICLAFVSTNSNAGVYFISGEEEVFSDVNNKPSCKMIGYDIKTCTGNKTPFFACPYNSKIFKICGCDESVYQYTTDNCASPKAPSGKSCDGKYESCGCDNTKYKYDSKNCVSPKKLAGGECSSKYQKCECPAEYSKTCKSPLVAGGDACGGKYKKCKCPAKFLDCGGNGGDVGATSCTEENGTVKYSSCYNFKCSDGSYKDAVPTNQTCTEVKYKSLTCYKDCRALTCEDGGYLGTQPSGQKCSSISYGGKTCYKKDCISTSCPAGKVDSVTYWGGMLNFFMKIVSTEDIGDLKCVALPTCASLGYTCNCSGRNAMRCPFDTTKTFCE